MLTQAVGANVTNSRYCGKLFGINYADSCRACYWNPMTKKPRKTDSKHIAEPWRTTKGMPRFKKPKPKQITRRKRPRTSKLSEVVELGRLMRSFDSSDFDRTRAILLLRELGPDELGVQRYSKYEKALFDPSRSELDALLSKPELTLSERIRAKELWVDLGHAFLGVKKYKEIGFSLFSDTIDSFWNLLRKPKRSDADYERLNELANLLGEEYFGKSRYKDVKNGFSHQNTPTNNEKFENVVRISLKSPFDTTDKGGNIDQSIPDGDVAESESAVIDYGSLPENPPKLWKPARGRPPVGEVGSRLLTFLREVYGGYLPKFKDRLRGYIYQKDRKLYQAIADFERENVLPDDLAMSNRDEKLQSRIRKAYEEGVGSLSPSERRSVRGKLNRTEKFNP